MSADELVARVEEAARKLPAGQVSTLAATLEEQPIATPTAKARATGAIASPAYADVAARLVDSWANVDGLSGAGLALAIRSAVAAVEAERGEQSIEIVWTGPQTTVVPVRLTRAVLIDLTRAARRSLIVVSFAAYKVQVVLMSWPRRPGGRHPLILETSRNWGNSFVRCREYVRVASRSRRSTSGLSISGPSRRVVRRCMRGSDRRRQFGTRDEAILATASERT
jgi:hypothetical protein